MAETLQHTHTHTHTHTHCSVSGERKNKQLKPERWAERSYSQRDWSVNYLPCALSPWKDWESIVVVFVCVFSSSYTRSTMIIIFARIYREGGGDSPNTKGVEMANVNICKVKFIGLHIWSRIDHEWTHTHTHWPVKPKHTHETKVKRTTLKCGSFFGLVNFCPALEPWSLGLYIYNRPCGSCRGPPGPRPSGLRRRCLLLLVSALGNLYN